MKHSILPIVIVLLLSACSLRQPDIIAPQHLHQSTAIEIKGRQGWLPGAKITFGAFSADVDKGWTKTKNNVFFPNMRVNEFKSRKVHIQQIGPTELPANFSYQQTCSAQGIRFDLNDWLGLDTVENFQDLTANIDINGQEWQLINNSLVDQQGNQLLVKQNTFYFNNDVIAEIMVGAYLGGFNSADYLWLDESQPPEIQLVMATMLTYLLTYQTLTCGEENTDFSSAE